jgi:DNA polymerase
MRHLSIDIETYSSVPIAKAGLYKYAQSPDFEILLFAWSWNFGPVQICDLTTENQLPESVLKALPDPEIQKHAYNAAFEWYCLSRYLGAMLPISQWRDTMLHALYCGYPASLDAAGKALGLSEDKRKLQTGKALIRTFCVPCKPTARNGGRTRVLPGHEPEKWELFKQYNQQDVVTEMEIERRLSFWPVPDEIQRQWEQDITINERGVGLDTQLVEGALECSEITTARLTKEAVSLSGLDNPNSVSQLTSWLENETGFEIDSLTKSTVSGLLNRNLESKNVRRMLEIRQELGKTSVKKYAAMETAVCEDNRVRGLLQFYGANRTGRWAGRIIQPQNLPRTRLHGAELSAARSWVKKREVDKIDLLAGPVPDILSQLIRTALVPAPGKRFIDADFSAIEARVIAWLAGEEWVLDVFRTHGKIYEACASQMFGVPIEKIKKGNPEYELRQKGKVATLALGYQGSTGALINMGALEMGIPEEELPDIVQRWRASNKRIQDLWYSMENAAVDTVRTGRTNAVRGLLLRIEGNRERYFLTIQLPSGRKLFYAQPKLGQNRFGRESLQYLGMNQTTKKWEAIETYGGKLVENCVQAVARDCLAENIGKLEASGCPVVFHVHDEVIIEKEISGPAEKELERVCGIMSQPIPWAPGLPLNADGWVGDYYTKD